MKVVAELCDEKMSRDIVSLFVDNYTEYKSSSVIRDVAPDFKNTLVHCGIFGKRQNCNHHFFPFLTEEGVCYTFNMINIDELVTDE